MPNNQSPPLVISSTIGTCVFGWAHVLVAMVSNLHMLAALVVLLPTNNDAVELPSDMIQQMAVKIKTIQEHNLAPLWGKTTCNYEDEECLFSSF